jgi:hypothetical protein
MAEKNRLYPHLMPLEIPIWEGFLSLHSSEYDRFEYDVRVGESITPPPDVDANIADMAVSLAKKRIDAVGWQGDNPTIIEIKSYAGLTAIGQLMTYPLLYTKEFPDHKPPGVLLVTMRLLPDIEFTLNTYSIPYMVLKPVG